MSTSPAMGTTGRLRCIVVTPESSAIDQKVDSIALPMEDGSMGILPGRAPLIGRLGYGELRLRTGNQIQNYYIDGGFVQVTRDTVTVLTEQAILPNQINVEKAKASLEESLKTASTVEDQEASQRQADRARAQIRMAEMKTVTS